MSLTDLTWYAPFLGALGSGGLLAAMALGYDPLGFHAARRRRLAALERPLRITRPADPVAVDPALIQLAGHDVSHLHEVDTEMGPEGRTTRVVRTWLVANTLGHPRLPADLPAAARRTFERWLHVPGPTTPPSGLKGWSLSFEGALTDEQARSAAEDLAIVAAAGAHWGMLRALAARWGREDRVDAPRWAALAAALAHEDPELARRGLEARDPWLRLSAADGLPAGERMDALVDLVADASMPSPIRTAALRELHERSPASAVDAVVAALTDPDDLARARALVPHVDADALAARLLPWLDDLPPSPHRTELGALVRAIRDRATPRQRLEGRLGLIEGPQEQGGLSLTDEAPRGRVSPARRDGDPADG